MTRPAPHTQAAGLDELASELVRDLFAALQIRRLRGSGDPRTLERRDLLADTIAAAAAEGPLRLYRHGPHLFVEGVRVLPTPDLRLATRALWQDLERFGIGGFEFDPETKATALDEFLDLYPQLERHLGGLEEEGAAGCPLAPGIRALPHHHDLAPPPDSVEEARRRQARRTFYRALAGARTIVRQFAVHRISELRKSRAIVHEMIDSMCDEEFSLLGLTAIQSFDSYTFQHSVHVSILSLALGQALGLPRKDLAELGVAALFHDMGKVRVPKAVLQKPGRFDTSDWAVMHTHPLAGARELIRFGGENGLAVKVMLVSAEHHMRFDASGYPSFGDGWAQGLFARIVSLTDCFDAMTASRAYMKRPFTPDAVIRYMLENAGRMFDPDLLRLFIGKVGLYPVGSLVCLESGELAVVFEAPAAPKEAQRPRVRVLVRRGQEWETGEERILSEGPAVDPSCRIQYGCHPLDFGIDVDVVLSRLFL